MWLVDVIHRNRVRFPDGIALRDSRRSTTWPQLQREVTALASALRREVPAQSRVALLSGNRIEMIEAYLACAFARLIAVPINPALTDPEIADIFGAVTPALAIADRAGRERLLAHHRDLPIQAIEDVPDLPVPKLPVDDPGGLTDPFAILMTSATTGRPKGVVVDQRSFQLKALSFLGEVRCDETTVFLDACPLFHGSVVQAFNYFASASTVCVLDVFTPRTCLTALQSWRVRHMLAVPSMVRLLLRTRELRTADLGALELIMHGAAPMPADLAEEVRAAFGVDLMTVFGITEGGGPSLALRADDRPSGPPAPGATCVGLPMLGTSVRVRRDDGTPADVGEIGEIFLAGDGLMQGYWNNPGATSEALRDGWLNTRDLGCLDAHGYLWVVDRRNDLILRGGQNVYPAEVEHVLRQSPRVADVAVVPAASLVWGQTPVAFIQPTAPDDFDERELLELCLASLASHKRPSRFVAVSRIPRSPAGKILRTQLRDHADALGTEGDSR